MASFLKLKIFCHRKHQFFSTSKWVGKRLIFKTRFTHRYSHPLIVFWYSHGAESLECRRCDFCRLRASAVTWIKDGLLRLKLCNLVVCNCWPIGPVCGASDTPGSTGDFCRLRASAVTWIKEGLLRLKLCNLVVCDCWPIGPACGAIDTPGSTGSNELARKLDRKLEWPLLEMDPLEIGRTDGVRLKMGTPHSSIWAMEPLACGAVDSTSSSASCNFKKMKYS